MAAHLIQALEETLTLDTLIDDFYERILADDRINRFFEHVDLSKQHKKMRHFLIVAFGGTEEFSRVGELAFKHKNLVDHGLSGEHFSAFLENLTSVMEVHEVPESLIKEIIALAESYRGLILGKS